MVVYTPVLKGRDGEFNAIKHLSKSLIPHVLPIFEVAPTKAGPINDAYKFGIKVRESVPSNLVVAVDVRPLADPADGPRRPIRDIADDLAGFQIPMLPVLHLYDGPERMADVGYAADLHGGDAVLRLGDETTDPDDAEAEENLDRMGNHAGLTTEQCHLVLDVFELQSERDLTRVEPVIRKCVSWSQRYGWRSVTVVAGGHAGEPLAPSRQYARAAPAPRPAAVAACAGSRCPVRGLRHRPPRMTQSGWAPMPNLRYTDDEMWWIYRWPRDTSTRAAMYDLCRALVASEHWAPGGTAFSWGDAEIAARAEGAGGPGNGTNWRAWGTSHHLAHVVDQLSRPDLHSPRRSPLPPVK